MHEQLTCDLRATRDVAAGTGVPTRSPSPTGSTDRRAGWGSPVRGQDQRDGWAVPPVAAYGMPVIIAKMSRS